MILILNGESIKKNSNSKLLTIFLGVGPIFMGRLEYIKQIQCNSFEKDVSGWQLWMELKKTFKYQRLKESEVIIFDNTLDMTCSIKDFQVTLQHMFSSKLV